MMENVQFERTEKSVEDIPTIKAIEIRELATATIGKTKPGRRFIDKQTWWWNDEIQDEIRLKKKAFKNWQQTRAPEDHLRYKGSKSKARKAVVQAKAAHYQDIYYDLATRSAENRIYKLCKSRNRATQDIDNVTAIRDENNKLLWEPRQILDRWKQDFERVTNEEFPHQPIPQQPLIYGPIPRITAEEISAAIIQMKSNKATGPDDIPVEVWKEMGTTGIETLEN